MNPATVLTKVHAMNELLSSATLVIGKTTASKQTKNKNRILIKQNNRNVWNKKGEQATPYIKADMQAIRQAG